MLDESKVDKYLARIVDREGGQSLKFVSPGMAGVPDRIVMHWSTYFGHKISKIRCQKIK